MNVLKLNDLIFIMFNYSKNETNQRRKKLNEFFKLSAVFICFDPLKQPKSFTYI